MTVTVKREPPAETQEVTCRGCKALLAFALDDLTGGYFEGDYTETGPRGVGVKCPRCETLTELKNAPSALIEKVWRAKERR